MRIAVLADIHGNYRALQAVLDEIEGLRVDGIFSLGDNIGYGPEPEEVVGALRRARVFSVMGNHELGLISKGYYNRLNHVPRESLRITRGMLSPDSIAWLAGLPATCVREGARLVHGCPPQSITTYLFAPSGNRLRRLFSIYPQRICFCGHTHNLNLFSIQGETIVSRQLQQEKIRLQADTRYIIIPGSVGQPRDPLSNRAKYAIWDVDDDTVTVHGVRYDVETTVRLLKERGFPVFNAVRLKGVLR